MRQKRARRLIRARLFPGFQKAMREANSEAVIGEGGRWTAYRVSDEKQFNSIVEYESRKSPVAGVPALFKSDVAGRYRGPGWYAVIAREMYVGMGCSLKFKEISLLREIKARVYEIVGEY